MITATCSSSSSPCSATVVGELLIANWSEEALSAPVISTNGTFKYFSNIHYSSFISSFFNKIVTSYNWYKWGSKFIYCVCVTCRFNSKCKAPSLGSVWIYILVVVILLLLVVLMPWCLESHYNVLSFEETAEDAHLMTCLLQSEWYVFMHGR